MHLTVPGSVDIYGAQLSGVPGIGIGFTEEFGWTHTVVEQYFGMFQAKTFDEFQQVHEEANGIPLFNTIATSADGRAWYADASATPDLSDAALARYEASLAADPIVKIAADNRAVLLDGSDPTFEWVEEPGARAPGWCRRPTSHRSSAVTTCSMPTTRSGCPTPITC